jgi:hypothetical protein
VRYKSRHRLLAEDVLHSAIPQRLTVVVRVDAVLVVGERRDELHRAMLVANRGWRC